MSTAVATPVQQIFPFPEVVEFGGEFVLRGMSKAAFIQISRRHPDLRMEREKNGDITIMAPVKGGSSIRENRLCTRVTNWRDKTKNGEVFNPSGGFDLPDGATKCPDVAWVSSEKMAQLTPEQVEDEFIPIVPDFIGEVRSKSDRLKRLQEKMLNTWVSNGVRLGWLIDPYDERVYVYREDGLFEVVKGFDNKISGEEVMPGFELDLSEFRLYGKK
ncbi:MAG: Uma2 family endonuclease [Saprospiraceae bacterium]|nr:MAG: Uma2 family endonuclease [Saprospiraceae bacterium]